MKAVAGQMKMRLGISPVSWTNDDLPELGQENTFEKCISEMAEAGYEGTEIGNKYPKDKHELKKALSRYGLQICNAWFSTWFTARPESETTEAFIRHRDFLYFQGARVIGCSEQGNSIQGKQLSIFKDKPVFSDQQWRQVISGMNHLAELAEEKGMKVCVHHHMGTGIQTPEEIDTLLANSNKNVYLLYDSGHLVFSEGDAASACTVLKKHIDRVVHVHLKDIRPEVYARAREEDLSFLEAVKAGVFTMPGDGMIDFRPIVRILADHDYRGWLLLEAEQDPQKAHPLTYARNAREYLLNILRNS